MRNFVPRVVVDVVGLGVVVVVVGLGVVVVINVEVVEGTGTVVVKGVVKGVSESFI